MRIKFLSVIVSFLLVSFAMSSCLGDDDPIEYSPNALLQAFALDTIHGVKYPFTIDQLSGRIYNQDSLPVGSDTIIDKILISITTTGFVTVRNAANTEDSIFNSEDSVNLVNTMEILPDGTPGKPFKFKIYAPDMMHTKEYSLSVRVHQQQPDSLNWGKGPIGTNFIPFTGKLKSIIFNKQILVYGTNSPDVYHTSLSNGNIGTSERWSSNPINGLPSTDITSIVNFNNALYATVTGNPKVYRSNDGISWEEASEFGNNTVVLIAPIGDVLTGIKTFGNEDKFCTTADGIIWLEEGVVPQDFPRNNISVASFKNITGVPNIMVVGNIPEEDKTANDTATVAWGYMIGQEWGPLTTNSSYTCPLLEDPSILHYGGALYIFGKDFKTFYKSDAGIVWKEVTSMFMFPQDQLIQVTDKEDNMQTEQIQGFRDKPADYSMVVDENNFIWIMRSGDGSPGAIATPGEVWRGKLNRLGFKRQ